MRTARLIAIALALLALLATAVASDSFRFTVTADPLSETRPYARLLSAMKTHVGGQGAFQVTLGDVTAPAKIRAQIDKVFGKSAPWIPVVGNHDEDRPAVMSWIRAEFSQGHDGRQPIKSHVKRMGPPDSRDTTYSFDHGNAHFIILNEYGSAGRSKAGRISPALLNWIKVDLAANTKPAIFVFGHEPAFPFHRHIHDSLDRDPKQRDAFWKLLESNGVSAYFCGHTHYYSRYRRPGGRVWQIDAGNTHNADHNGNTFIDVIVSDREIRYNAWRDPHNTGKFAIADTWTQPLPAR